MSLEDNAAQNTPKHIFRQTGSPDLRTHVCRSIHDDLRHALKPPHGGSGTKRNQRQILPSQHATDDRSGDTLKSNNPNEKLRSSTHVHSVQQRALLSFAKENQLERAMTGLAGRELWVEATFIRAQRAAGLLLPDEEACSPTGLLSSSWSVL